MYFDAVLNARYEPLFNGTPEETQTWLKKNAKNRKDIAGVCIGETLKVVTVEKYLKP